jgi:hypothetical protein
MFIYIFLLVVLAPLSPRAGAAVSTKRERKYVLSRKDCECSTSCTAARVFKFCIQGHSSIFKVLLNFLSPRMHAALSEGRGLSSLSCNKFFAVFFGKCLFVILVTVLHDKCYIVSEIISPLDSALEPGPPAGVDPECEEENAVYAHPYCGVVWDSDCGLNWRVSPSTTH